MTKAIAKGVASDTISATGVADGAHPEYFDLAAFSRADFRITQDGGSGTSTMTVFASWTPNDTDDLTALTYTDIGNDFYGSATFTDPSETLIDNGEMLRGATAIKFVFTVSGASADASYSIEAIFLSPGSD